MQVKKFRLLTSGKHVNRTKWKVCWIRIFLEFSHNTKNTKLEIDSDMDNIVSKFEADWGLSLEEVYGIAKKFFKGLL